MPTTEVNGIELYYEEHGRGYPVVFLHGFAGGTHMWGPQVSVFSENYRFIIYDNRGHGQSESPSSPDQYSYDIVLEDLYQLLGKLDISRVVLGGLSMGGLLCLRFYLKHPEMVTALILMDSGPGYRNPTHRAEYNRVCEAQAEFLETEGIVAFADDPQTPIDFPYTPREIMLRHKPTGLANMSRKVVAQHNSQVMERLSEVKVPTLVLVGELDTSFLRAADYMTKTIPGARQVTIPQAGHGANLDNPAAFNQAVLSFLDELYLQK